MADITDSHSARVLYDPDGEGIDRTDDNDAQLLWSAQLFDNLLASGMSDAVDNPPGSGTALDLEIGNLWNASDFSDQEIVMAPYPGCAYMRAGVGARTLVTVPGPILVPANDELFSATGETAAPFRLGSATTLTTAVGDATNPRIDLVEVKALYVDSDSTLRDFEDAVTREPTSQSTMKRRRVQLTIQIKAGTPGASPAYPACSAGFQPMCAVWVPALHNAVHDPANIRDMRWPLGKITVIDTEANQFWLPGTPFVWSLRPGSPGPNFDAIGPAGGAADMYAMCPISSKAARLVGIGVFGKGDSGPTSCKLVRIERTASAPTQTELMNFGTDLIDAEAFRTVSALQMMESISLLAPESKGTKHVDTRIGTPIWCSGYSAGSARPRTSNADAHGTKLALKFSTSVNTDRVAFVRWYIAEGL